MIMARLKQETQPYHQALESTPNSVVLMSEQVSIDSYRQLLEKFYGFHVPVEKQFGRFQQEWIDCGFDIDERRKVQLLEHDFDLLGITPASLPICADIPDLSSLPQMLGCLYVLEGSTLGGQIITRHLRKHLALGEFHYFNSYQERVGLQWKAFGAMVNHYAETAVVEDQIVAAASETFIKLKAWLTC